jgi:hypothetical protein
MNRVATECDEVAAGCNRDDPHSVLSPLSQSCFFLALVAKAG